MTQVREPDHMPQLTAEGAADALEDAAVYLQKANMALYRFGRGKGGRFMKTRVALAIHEHQQKLAILASFLADKADQLRDID